MLGPRFPRPLLPRSWAIPTFERVPGRIRGPGRGLRTVTAVAVGVCMNLGARLGPRVGKEPRGSAINVMQQCIAGLLRPIPGVWEEKDPSIFPLKGFC